MTTSSVCCLVGCLVAGWGGLIALLVDFHAYLICDISLKQKKNRSTLFYPS